MLKVNKIFIKIEFSQEIHNNEDTFSLGIIN